VTIAAVRGTRDLLPDDMAWYRVVEDTARDVFERFGYRPIRTPIFEATELFVRGVGEGTDIVEKEMYTFEDRGGRSVTLRPEGTAAVARACIEHGLVDRAGAQKLHYIGPMYRYERPQAGRYREFWQAGIEAFGVAAPAMDAEVLTCAHVLLAELGIKAFPLQLNSIGGEERPMYVQRLRDFVRPNVSALCGKCQQRFERNPLRLFDCKTPACRDVLAAAPKILDHLSGESQAHLAEVRRLLDRVGVPYELNPYIVRGLDYYTRTAFEVTAEGLGSQDAILAGGRYDGLIGQVGGRPAPGVGFAAGTDRLVLAMQAQGVRPPEPPATGVFVATLGERGRDAAFDVTTALRRIGIASEMELNARSLRAQMKTADQLGARYALLIGEDELAREAATVREMRSGTQESVPLTDVVAYLAGRINSPARS
jgi:histidyl-tRNA synthetase